MGSIFGFSRLQSPAFQGQRDITIYVEHVPTVFVSTGEFTGFQGFRGSSGAKCVGSSGVSWVDRGERLPGGILSMESHPSKKPY